VPFGSLTGFPGENNPTGSSHQGLTVADLFTFYEAPLRAYSLSLTGDYDWADDLVQETFIKAMNNLALLSSLNPYQRRTWLYKVIKNRFIDDQRALTRHQNLLAQLTEDTQDAYTVTAELAQSFLTRHVPEHYRQLLEKRYVLGMTSQEIAKELRIPEATARSRLNYAINWLRTHKTD
jgi:RNA polymerase sigma-70 factor (ECF subfamily)